MRASEFTIVEKKRRKRKPRWAAYGPGPYGGYGFATGYSGDSGGGGDGGAVGEGWKDWVAAGTLGAAALGAGNSAYDAYKSSQAEKEPTPIVAKADQKSDFKKGVDTIAKDAVPKHLVSGSPHEKFLTKAAVEAGITGEELAQFLAQTAHESHNFKSMVEYGGANYFKKYEPKFAKDKKTGKTIINSKTKKPKNFNPKAVTLGNDRPGDGERFKGRGYIQLTGKYNYKQAGNALGLDLVNKPELVEKPEVAAKVAVWFWQNRVQPKVDDFSNTRAATKPINSGLKGLPDRKEKFQDYKVAMK
jgi:predicted chitinase